MGFELPSNMDFGGFWQRQKDTMREIATEFKNNVDRTASEIMHFTNIVNKWTQRALEGTVVAAGVQKALVGVQIIQTGIAVKMLYGQALASISSPLPGGIARGAFLMGLAADLTIEIGYLQSQRLAAETAQIESKAQSANVKQWRESYN